MIWSFFRYRYFSKVASIPELWDRIKLLTENLTKFQMLAIEADRADCRKRAKIRNFVKFSVSQHIRPHCSASDATLKIWKFLDLPKKILWSKAPTYLLWYQVIKFLKASLILTLYCNSNLLLLPQFLFTLLQSFARTNVVPLEK